MFVLETNTPRFFPPPLESTFNVLPFKELNEKLAGPSVPVPLHSTPYTSLVPPLDAPELSTVNTVVRSFAVAVDVLPKTMPFKV
jgi:hypothetical protein